MRSFPTGDHVKLFLSVMKPLRNLQEYQETAARAHQKLDIVYEDDNILLINKPVGMLSQPADDKEPSLVEYLTGYLLESGAVTESVLTYLPPICVQPAGPKYQRSCGCRKIPGRTSGAFFHCFMTEAFTNFTAAW